MTLSLRHPFAQVVAIAGLFALLLNSCGPGSGALTEPSNPTDGVKADTTGMRPELDFAAAIEARRASGDSTLADVQRMRRVLTDSIPGYRMEIDIADTLKMPLTSITEAKRVFYNKAGGYIELALTDYVQDPAFMQLSLHRHNLAQSVEVQGIIEARKQAPGFLPALAKDAYTWSSWNKARQSAFVYVGVDYRYFLSVEATPHEGFLDLAQVGKWLHWEALLQP
jgi:hypothetical protein